MPSRIAQLATSPLQLNYAILQSQAAIRKIGAFLAPLVEVADLTFRYKIFTSKNMYRIPNTRRQPGGKATRLGFSAADGTGTIEPNALDFPIPNAEKLSDAALRIAIRVGQTTLSDVSGLALENEQIGNAVTALTNASPISFDWGSNANDPIGDPAKGLDIIIKNVKLGVGNGAKIKVLFGTTAFLKFRNNAKVLARYIVNVGSGSKNATATGVVSPSIADIGNLLFTTPDVEMSELVADTADEGLAPNIQFILDNAVIVFASNDTPNQMDPSFMKTFSPMGGLFLPGAYTTEDERDQVLKMDWNTLPLVTNVTAGQLITTP